MQSNRDYATENLNLERKIKEYQEHFIMLNGKMKDLEKENQKLKKVIEIFKKKIRFSTYESLKNQIVLFSNDFGIHIYTIYCETKEDYELMKEVFKK